MFGQADEQHRTGIVPWRVVMRKACSRPQPVATAQRVWKPRRVLCVERAAPGVYAPCEQPHGRLAFASSRMRK